MFSYAKLLFTLILAMEKNNDDTKPNYYSSNRHDPAEDILRTEVRLEMLEEGSTQAQIPSCIREKQPYRKRSASYWVEGGIEAARSKR